VARAEDVLRALEEGREGHKPLARIGDLPLFAASVPTKPMRPNGFEEAIRAIEPDSLTPKEALELIYKLKNIKS
jgi:DNA mismatch repair protein MutS